MNSEKNLKVELIPTQECIPYERNPRKNDRAVEIVAKSIKEFGFKVPIILDKDNVIIAGHTRLKAAVKLGMQEVPVIWADDLTPEQVKAFRIMDNKSTEYATWNFELLKQEMHELNEKGFDLKLTGFSDGEINNLDFFSGKNLNIIPKEQKYQINEGELWQLGEHKLLCGNNQSPENFQKLMQNEKATVIFTDPPYNINYRPFGFRGSQDAYSAGKYEHKKVFSDNMKPEEFKEFLKKALNHCFNYSKDKTAICLWMGDKNLHIAIQAMIESKFLINQICAWIKNSIVFSPGCAFHKIMEYGIIGFKEGHKPEISRQYVKNQENLFTYPYRSFQDMVNTIDAWYIERDKTQEYNHPTQKPTELTFPTIFAFTNEEDILLDCFGGSGSSLIACEVHKRKCRIMELDPYYCDVIIQRWENLTGKKAEKIGGN